MHVAHGAMWQRNDIRDRLPALPWEPFGPGNPQNTQGPAAQLQVSMAKAVVSKRIPKTEVAVVLPCKCCTWSWDACRGAQRGGSVTGAALSWKHQCWHFYNQESWICWDLTPESLLLQVVKQKNTNIWVKKSSIGPWRYKHIFLEQLPASSIHLTSVTTAWHSWDVLTLLLFHCRFFVCLFVCGVGRNLCLSQIWIPKLNNAVMPTPRTVKLISLK